MPTNGVYGPHRLSMIQYDDGGFRRGIAYYNEPFGEEGVVALSGRSFEVLELSNGKVMLSRTLDREAVSGWSAAEAVMVLVDDGSVRCFCMPGTS